MEKKIAFLKVISRLMIHILLSIIALVLFIPLAGIGILWAIGALCFRAKLINALKRIGDYFLLVSISVDQAGNTFCAELFNDVMIKPKGHPFGNPDETISSVLGKNKRDNTLTSAGKVLSWTLDALDSNHVIKSIESW